VRHSTDIEKNVQEIQPVPGYAGEMGRITDPLKNYPAEVLALAREIEAARFLTRGHLAAACSVAGVDLPINLAADNTDKRGRLTPRQAAAKPVLRPDMIAFSDAVLPEAEVVISVSGVPPHAVTLLHQDRFAYNDAEPGEDFSEPDWHKTGAEHPRCDHAAWMLALLGMRHNWRRRPQAPVGD